jgi:nucleoside-diphosphate-sugar epimerase
VVATQNVTAYAQRAGCQRFIHISTPSLYVDRVPRLNVRETDYLPDFALNYYISTKKTAERLVLEARGLPAVVLRPQGLVGRGDRAIFPRIIRVARKGFVPRIGSGMTLTDLTHVENVVEAVVCALRAGPGSIGEVYNVSNGQPVELYGVIESLLSELKMPFRWRPLPFKLAYHVAAGLEGISRTVLLGREPLLTRYTACTLGLSRTLNIEKARRELDYEPRHTLAQAMDEVVREMREA